MLSALSRVQIDVIDSSGMHVARDWRFDVRTFATLMETLHSKVWIVRPYAASQSVAGVGLKQGRIGDAVGAPLIMGVV
jgi:hypothetical protein